MLRAFDRNSAAGVLSRRYFSERLLTALLFDLCLFVDNAPHRAAKNGSHNNVATCL